jgi:anti-sigma regulatory factor (Ser/Thr protein kinase)
VTKHLTIKTLNSISLNKLLAWHNPFIERECKYDLSEVRLITPGALVPMTASCHALARDGRSPVIIVRDQGVRTYLLRSGFANAVKDIATFEPKYPRITANSLDALRGSNPMLLEVTRIENNSALPELLSQIVWVLRNRMRYRRNDAFDIATAISEICQNTFDHNQQVCGFIAMQCYGKGTTRFVEIAISDYGDGLAATLKRNAKNPVINSDLDAITTAIRLGTSQYDDPTRGTGLHHLLETAHKHKGSLQIRSGTATMRLRMDKRTRMNFIASMMPGVQICLTLDSKLGT